MVKFGSPGFFLIPVNGRDITMNDANIEMSCVYIDSISGIPTSFTPATPPTWNTENVVELSLTALEMEHDRFILKTKNLATADTALATTITDIETYQEPEDVDLSPVLTAIEGVDTKLDNLDIDLTPVTEALAVVDSNVDTIVTTTNAIKLKTDKIPNNPASVGSQMSLSSSGILGVSGAVDSALATYDPPTRTEATADKAEIEGMISALVAPDNTSILAIKAKTDNLPASPAAVGSQMALNSTGIASVTTALNTYDAIKRSEATDDKNEIKSAINGLISPDNASIALIKAKTDNLPASPASSADALSALNSYGASKEATLNSVYLSLSQLSQSIKDKVDTLSNTDISSLATSSEIEVLSGLVTTIDGIVDNIKEKVDTLENTDISSLATSAEVTAIDGKVDTIVDNTNDLDATLLSLQESSSEISAVAGESTEAIQAVADASATLENAVGSIETSLAGVDSDMSALVNAVRAIDGNDRIILTPVNMETGEITIVKGSSYGYGDGEPAILWTADGVPDLTLNEVSIVIGQYTFPAEAIGPGSILITLTSIQTGYLKSANAQVRVKVDAENYNLYPMGFVRVVTL